MTVNFVVKLGQVPPPEVGLTGIGAFYIADGERYDPKCVLPDGTVTDLPANDMVPLDHKLLFQDVPDSGTLYPLAHAPVAIGVHKIGLQPATDGGEYLIDFSTSLQVIARISEGTPGELCEQCHGIGITW